MSTDEFVLPEVEAPPARRRLPLPRSPQALAIVILLALVLAEGVLLLRASDGDSATRSDVIRTSQRFLTLLTTYNADTLASQREAVLGLAAGRFRTEYTTLTGPEFQAALRERQADSKGKVDKIAVTSLAGDDATVLATVEVSTTNKDLPDPRVERNLIEVSLVRSGGSWRIDAVTILGTLG